jgi:hypothetical protein
MRAHTWQFVLPQVLPTERRHITTSTKDAASSGFITCHFAQELEAIGGRIFDNLLLVEAFRVLLYRHLCK